MGVCSVALTWIRRNMIRFPSSVIVYMPRNTHEEQLLEPGVTGEPQKLKLSLSAQVGPFHVLQCSVTWKERTTERSETPEALTG